MWRVPVSGSRATLAVAVSMAAACAGGDKLVEPDVPTAPTVAQVIVSPSVAQLMAGESLQFRATLRDADGNSLTGPAVEWSSDAPDVGTVSPSGVVLGIADGTLQVSAESEGKRGIASVTVRGWTLVGAGDIADNTSGDEATARILDSLVALGVPTTVFTVGDNVYDDGTLAEFTQYYAPTWGRHKAITRPAPGNHDYSTSGAQGYFQYFGGSAGPAGLGYYSYALGPWHVVSLNSNVAMGAGSAQEQWLRADLAATTSSCVLAYWHHPRFSSGNHGSEVTTGPLFQALYDHGVEVLVVAHDHNYERFAPQDPSAALDLARGVREFVVGTGGRALRSFGSLKANTQVRYDAGFGVIKFTLNDGSYTWEFISEAGKTFTDSGGGICR